MGAKLGKVDDHGSPVSNMSAGAMSSNEALSVTKDLDFNSLCNRSKAMLSALVNNPGKELQDRIAESIQSNPLRLNKQFQEMAEYQSCLKEDFTMEMVEKIAMIKEN